MPIPKIIHQTFKSKNLPLITRWHIFRFLKRNPEYQYEFYDDERIEKFLSEEFDDETFKLYQKLNIGAAKADFFRYAILLKKGGIYLDIDSLIRGRLRDFIKAEDTAIISSERSTGFFVQWALIYEPEHPFLKQTLDILYENIKENKHPHDVHSMTGPKPYTDAINLCLSQGNNKPPYRLLGTDYNGHFKFKYWFSNFLYRRGEHWKMAQLNKPILQT